MPIYRPRAIATLTVPVLGTREQRIQQAASTESLTLTVRPVSVRLESNDHNEADRLSLSLDWTDCGLDPRMLDDAVVALYLGNADENGIFEPDFSNLRFIGLATDVNAERTLESSGTLSMECVDYTRLFLKAKPFGSSGVPEYSETLEEAWARICSQTPGAEALATRIVFEGFEDSPVLGNAVAKRFQGKAKVPTKPDTDAWAVWQQCAGMCGLISYIRGDVCVVTTATNYYTEQDPPLLEWGVNIDKWSESRNTDLARKGVCLTSYDPISRTTIEAFFPPVGDERVKRKRVAPKKTSKKSKKKAKSQEEQDAEARLRESRDYFAYPGVTNPDVLVQCAERVWEERSRQELEGRVSTGEMQTKTVKGKDFDLLTLKAGDSITIRVDAEQRQLLTRLPTEGARIRYLTNRGYNEGVARVMVANAKEFAALGSTFFVRSVAIELELDDDGGGTFDIEINYINRIQIGGGT